MSFLDYFRAKPEPVVQVAAQPIEFNIKADSPVAFKRNLGRIITLYEAIAQGDNRSELKQELDARLQACKNLGHEPPRSLGQAKELFNKVA